MSARITDITRDFFTFWERAQSADRGEQKRLWQELYEEPNREVFEIYYGRFGSRSVLDQALDRFPAVIASMERARSGLQGRIETSLTRSAELFGLPGAEFEYVTMVGLFCSNGWAWEYRGSTASFLALEWFSDPIYLDILIAHEAAHAFHAQGNGHPWRTSGIGESLFREGLSTLASALLYPGLPDQAYLNFGPGGGAWLAQCEQRSSELAGLLLRDFEQEAEQIYRTYFMMASEEESDLPVRSGYYIGYRAVQELNRRFPLAEMARWSPERARAELSAVLERLAAAVR